VNSKVNFKESDLFRFYQSIDLGNLHVHHEIGRQLMPKMPHVMRLRSTLYSQEWRHFVERLCSLPRGTLTDQVDCACNCHTSGCHLLCHDDVIGTRKVSYILYLTDHEPSPWQAHEGGALELYGSVVEQSENDRNSTGAFKVPDTVPSQWYLPIFNQMAYFVVEPGASFHAIQEVRGDRPRLSLQGWYHAATVPPNFEMATLQQLKGKKSSRQATVAIDGEGDVEQAEEDDDDDGFRLFPVVEAGGEAVLIENSSDSGDAEKKPEASMRDDTPPLLSQLDRQYLDQFLDATYLTEEALRDIQGRVEKDSSVQLRGWLNKGWADRIRTAISAIDIQEDGAKLASKEESSNGSDRCYIQPEYYNRGVDTNWKLCGPSHKQRYLEYSVESSALSRDSSSATTIGDMLAYLRRNLLESAPFGRYLRAITSLGVPLASRGSARRFRRGLDYTVAHYGLLTKRSILDATLCFVAGLGQDVSGSSGEESGDEDETDDADEAWQSGEYGGFECYISADDDEDDEAGGLHHQAADEYNTNDDSELLSVSASFNTLNVVYRNPGTLRFVKYVGSQAPSSRWDLSMEYRMEEGDDSEQEDDELDDDCDDDVRGEA
jgi:prolyl 3-hydroxylase /prolyl 3,4-dihydroxylase